MPTRFHPVLMGTDLGVYSIARSCHEAYGLRSVVVSNQARGPISHSAIIENVFAGAGASEERQVEVLIEVAEARRDAPRVLLVNAEHEIEFVQRHREVLAEHYVLPYAPGDVLARAGDKAALAEACRAVGAATPPSQEIDLSGADAEDWAPPAIELRFPVVLKPAVSAAHLLMSYPGKRKVHTAGDAAEAERVLRLLARAGLREVVVAQELIPGDDTQGRTVTCYIDRSGTPTMMASGQLILGLHAPTMIGNSATILTTPQPELCEQTAAVLRHLGFTGYANLDIKVDPRDGTAYFLDLNPRIGRPNYYVNVAGVNPIPALVADHLGDGRGSRAAPLPVHREVGVYSYLPWWLVRRYVRDRELRRTLGRIRATRRFTHPLAYPADRNPRRWLYRQAATANLVRDFRAHYPRPTDTGL